MGLERPFGVVSVHYPITQQVKHSSAGLSEQPLPYTTSIAEAARCYLLAAWEVRGVRLVGCT